MTNILDDKYFNLNNWRKNMNSFPVFQNTYSDGVNTLQYQGGGGFERIYIPLNVVMNREYIFKFKMYSPTGFQMGGYGHDYAFAFVRTSAPSDTREALYYSNLAYSQNWVTSASDEAVQYSISFNSDNYTSLYVALDFGYILDGVTCTYVFSDFELNINEIEPVYNFDGKIHSDNSWIDTMNSKNMVVAKGSFNWENNSLVLTKNTNYFNLPTDYGSYGTFEILVKIDESFTPVSDSNWYITSCIFGCELGGTQRDWGFVIDRNGMFAIGHGNSSITSTDIVANDGVWHTLTMVVDSSSIKLYIDGQLKKTVSITMTGTQVSTFGVGWNNSGSGTSITGHIGTLKVWNASLTDEEILNSYENNLLWIADGVRKYLVMAQSIIYTITDGLLTPLTNSQLSSATFSNYGVDEMPDWSIISSLINPKILLWNVSEDGFPKLTASMTATPFPQTMESEDYDMTDETILGIETVLVDASDDVRFAISFDQGQTWKLHTGEIWATLSEGDTGMSPSIMSAISTEDWNSESTTGIFRFRVTLPSSDSFLNSLVVDYLN